MSKSTYSQSTFATVLGTVKDPSGAVIPRAGIDLTNTGTTTVRSTESDASGGYVFPDLEVGTYQLSVEASGFEKVQYPAFHLTARATVRVDIGLRIASQATNVTVEIGAEVPVVSTDLSSIAETKSTLELTDLPVAITTRSSGSTSAFSTLTAQPGVQTDASGNISVAGTEPNQLSISIDGITSFGPASYGPLTELFPSFNAIEEIRIGETLNPAEYGGVSDITTVSKSGANNFHGGAFENVQNNDFNASNTFSHTVPLLKMNDFGAYLGGPVILPRYNGRNKTFFFGSFEALRLPKSQVSILSVPTQAMRNGNLSAYPEVLAPYPNNIIPPSQLNQFGQGILNNFYPLPNYGAPGAIANNYITNFLVPINSAQGDLRVDHVISPKHLIFARYTYKNERQTAVPSGTPELGITQEPSVYNALTVAYNWLVTASVVNEARGGFSGINHSVSFGPNTQQVVSELGLQNLPTIPAPTGPQALQVIPTISITGFTGLSAPTAYAVPHQHNTQFLDNLTWTRGKHTVKVGGDYRYSSAYWTGTFGSYQLGDWTYNGSATTAYFGNRQIAPIAGLLTGYPDSTTVLSIIQQNQSGYGSQYAFFAQDDWKASQSFTLNFGLRWEYHPVFRDHLNNTGNFDPDYTSFQNGVVVHGAIILPPNAPVNPLVVQDVAPMPVIPASQAGVPDGLRDSPLTDFAPRIGFAWRIFGNNKTVLRGGFGMFIEAELGSSLYGGGGIPSSAIGTFTNSLKTGAPVFQAPYSFPSNIAQPGTYYVDLGMAIPWKDPKVDQWNLTLERDLGKGVGVRASYDGNHGWLRTVENLNQLPVNTVGYNALESQVPFPYLGEILDMGNLGFSNRNAGTFSVHKRSASLLVEASYTYTRDLTNDYGASTGAASLTSDNTFGGTLSNPSQPSITMGMFRTIAASDSWLRFFTSFPLVRARSS